MVSKTGPSTTLKGQYRISDRIVFQKHTPTDAELNKQVGKNFPRGKKTRLEFTDFRAVDRSGEWRKGMKGTARLTYERYGRWTGILTDQSGNNWQFTCNRVKE
ncbi:hypothetical protein [Stieleria neptunia]|nr:hypothetical protein [Stieleria neptunia]